MLEIVRISPDFAIGPQPEAEDISGLSAAGFAAVLNARPDEEIGDFPRAAEAEALARAAGLAYAHAPTENHAIFEEDVIDAFERALVNLPTPIFAHCKSGTRTAILWALVAARHRPVEEVIATLRAAGQELDFLEDEMRESANAANRSKLRLKDDGLLRLGQSALMGAPPS